MAGHDAHEHARHMDAIYRSQRHFYDFTRKYYLLGRDRLIRELAPPPGGSVIEVGCGTARNLIAAAKVWPQARFYGFDISEAMLETARASVARAGLADRITLAQGDATTFDPKALFGIDAPDRVFMSYTLSMIPDWRGTIARGAEVLGPDGRLSIVDFGQQEGLPGAWRKLLFAWLAKFDVTPRAELDPAAREVAAARGLTARFRPLYRGYAWSAGITRD
ncbi:class I SAM-dependent methyltransferase [Sphingomonas sp.]|uniref:class I SAM-dependent methyltransferase n=1 Tax=Sphingomonas sp. TaxID=28214 RepID=UPI002BF10268|nr:class I SAM-dependent methyltransferase [Sphingomonas sp.]HWK35192.1 class I SAM-dependent methyltransferase [Sphingomonas sp.]